MSDVIIRASDLRKVYRLYSKPSYRFRDMFGLLGAKAGAYTEHAALDGINLEIGRGEKVAIIGRNGAGKSTFLKLVTNVITPTSGRLDVVGQVQALLQIGTGFHPDFTGRENVHAYFAQLGIVGAEARRKCEETIEFAELEEYIDQPMKTYSTGMGVRLMFSASTAITPELLVLDEVLGVGDAYFTHKSYERIREMCEQQHTTLLLVTHDIYSATQICGRVVWIDRGRVLMDGDSQKVVMAYEDSVRQQEENRLRVRKQQRARELPPDPSARRTPILVEIYAHENRPQPSPVHFSRVELLAGDQPLAAWPLTEGERAFQDESIAHLQRDGTSWGDVVEWRGRKGRTLLNYGSPFHKVAGVFQLDMAEAEVLDGSLAVRLDYGSDEPCALHARAFVGSREVYLGQLAPSDGAWRQASFVLQGSASSDDTASTGLNLSGRHGTGAITVDEVIAADDDGRETYVFEHGLPANVLIRYRISHPELCERAQVLLAFHRDGIVDTCRMITRELSFNARVSPRGSIRVRLPRTPFANGTYTVTVMIAKEGYYDRAQVKYFSLNPEVYTCLSRVIEIVIRGAGIVVTGTGLLYEGEWSLVEGGARVQ